MTGASKPEIGATMSKSSHLRGMTERQQEMGEMDIMQMDPMEHRGAAAMMSYQDDMHAGESFLSSEVM